MIRGSGNLGKAGNVVTRFLVIRNDRMACSMAVVLVRRVYYRDNVVRDDYKNQNHDNNNQLDLSMLGSIYSLCCKLCHREILARSHSLTIVICSGRP